MVEASPQDNEVVVLCWDVPTRRDERAKTIAEFAGAEAKFAALSPSALDDNSSFRQAVPKCTCLIVDAETLAKYVDSAPKGVGCLNGFNEVANHVFLYGFQPSRRHDAILQAVSSGHLLGVQPVDSADATLHVSAGSRAWCRQFSGLSFKAADQYPERTFVVNATRPPHTVLIKAGDTPFFVREDLGDSSLFLLSSSDLADLDEKVGQETRLLSWFSRLVPLLMFLRGTLGNAIWHSDYPQACFIIDDPLLQHRYGFLEYPKLRNALTQFGFSVSIAFIPWNYRRSHKHIAELFSRTPAALSICVHGCDHTRAEFATTDFEALLAKARLAIGRMERHRQLFGVAFDNVMVFPQGLFSAEALAALKECDYLAAVNTHLFPVHMPQGMPLRDLLDVAVTSFSGFPLFGRLYPQEPAEFAFALFLGKPAFLVEHHGYFRDGYAAVGALVEQLNQLDEPLEWNSLGQICSRASLQRTRPDGQVHIRFFTNRFHLTNEATRTQTFRLFRRHAPGTPLPRLTVGGQQWTCEQSGENLTFSVSLDAGQVTAIAIHADNNRTAHATAPRKPTLFHNAQILTRRALCEIRDNYVDTNRTLSAAVSLARKVRLRRHRRVEPTHANP